MRGARNKQRGYEHEREIVLWAQSLGFDCRRIFGSGAFKAQLGDDFAGDIVLEGLRIEAKRRKAGFNPAHPAISRRMCQICTPLASATTTFMEETGSAPTRSCHASSPGCLLDRRSSTTCHHSRSDMPICHNPFKIAKWPENKRGTMTCWRAAKQMTKTPI